jgi:hypothetical protein
MPLGSFRLNSLAKKLAAAVASWATWNGTKDTGQIGGPSTGANFVRFSDTQGFFWWRNSGGPASVGLANRTGKEFTVISSSVVSTIAGNNSPTVCVSNASLGILFFTSDYPGQLVKVYGVGASTFSYSNSPSVPAGAVVKERRALRINSSGNLVQWGRQDGTNYVIRNVLPISGTSTISFGTPVTTQYTSIGAIVNNTNKILSIATISDTEAIAIVGGSGNVKAFRLNDNGTATQIGSTYTGTFTYIPVTTNDVEARKTEQQNLFHNFAAMVVIQSDGSHRYFKATESSFQNFTISNPLTPHNVDVTECVSVCSLDENRVMFAISNNSGAGQDGFAKAWVVDFSTNALIYHKDTGFYGADPGQVRVTSWTNDLVLLSGMDPSPTMFLSII